MSIVVLVSLHAIYFGKVHGDTLWLMDGRVLQCEKVVDVKAGGFLKKHLLRAPVCNKRIVCGTDTIGIDELFAQHDSSGYYRVYKCELAKRVSVGRVSFYQVTNCPSQWVDGPDGSMINMGSGREIKKRLYALGDEPLLEYAGRIDNALRGALGSCDRSKKYLARADVVTRTAIPMVCIGSAGLVAACFPWVKHSQKGPLACIGGGLVISGGIMLQLGTREKDKSIDAFNTACGAGTK